MEAIHAVAVAVAILTAEVEGEDIMGVEAGIAVEEEEEVTEVSDIFTHTTHTHTHTHNAFIKYHTIMPLPYPFSSAESSNRFLDQLNLVLSSFTLFVR